MNSPDVTADSPGWMRVLFSCQGDQFTVKDVIEAARWRGDLDKACRELSTAIGCEARAAQLKLEPNEVEIQRLSEEFRYQRDLLTTEETERWLIAHDVTEEEFSDYFLRSYWRRNLPEADRVELDEAAIGGEGFAELLRVELMLSGEFEPLERELSCRAAALHSEGRSKESKAELQAKGVFGEWCSRAEAAYRDVCGRVLTEDSRTRMLAAMRILLTRVVVESVVLKSSAAAREATLCLRNQEMTMDELSQEAGSACARVEIFLGDCDEEYQRRLLCAAPGEVLEQASDDGVVVSRLLDKTEPKIGDEVIRAKVDGRLLDAYLAELASKVITRPSVAENLR